MNSYPAELIDHAYASLFVAGITAPSSSRTPREATSPQVKTQGQSSVQASDNAAGPSTATARASNPDQETPVASLLQHPTEAYPQLCRELQNAFDSRGKNGPWDPARGRSAVFHAIKVDHNVRLPPRKTRPSSRSVAAPDSSSNHALLASLPPRSPLSPLHPSSPLFPDGLIAPIWVRKHRELVPSVFVAFYTLAEAFVPAKHGEGVSNTSESINGDSDIPAEKQGDTSGKSDRRALSGQELKARDDELVNVITDRRRSLIERGIKLTVVLLTSRDMLESQQLEARLSYIRRSSGLDSKASLFVLTPVKAEELTDFVTSLQGALYDHALDYYREHARRVKRKRTRYPPTPAVVQPILQAVATARQGSRGPELNQLSREGWHVRAEYKLAMFAELHTDYQEALDHYIEAYELLVGPRGMLGSTALLPPRTKRWAEAKVLADTLSVRLCRLWLYAGEARAAVAQLRRHLSRFAELSSGWGIGDATFEFWSWLSKQHRLFGGLVEQATLSSPVATYEPIQIPIHAPPLPGFLLHPEVADESQKYSSLQASSGTLLPPNAAAMASGVSTATMLQSAASCYYLAALCTVERHRRYTRMLALEKKQELSESAIAALVYEKKVDHCAQMVDGFSLARNWYSKSGRPRLAALMTTKMAYAYAEHSQHQQALRLLERQVDQMVTDDSWATIKTQLVMLALRSASQSEARSSELRLALRALSLANRSTELGGLSGEQSQEVSRVWSALTSTKSSENDESIELLFNADAGPVQATVVYLRSSVERGDSVPFQLTVTGPSIDGVEMSFDSLTLVDRSGQEVAHLTHDVTASKTGDIVRLDGTVAHLTWRSRDVMVMQGSLSAMTKATDIGLAQVILRASAPSAYTLRLSVNATQSPSPEMISPSWLCRRAKPSAKARWVSLPLQENSGLVRLTRPAHKLEVKVDHKAQGYLDETLHITLTVTNREAEKSLLCTLRANLISSLPMESQDELSVLGKQPTLSGELSGIPVGTLAPGQSEQLVIVVRGRHRSATRTLDVAVYSRGAANETEDAGTVDREELDGEIKQQVAIPIFRAFRAEYSASWRGMSFNKNVAVEDELSTTGKADAFEPAAASSRGGNADRRAIADMHVSFGVLTQDKVSLRGVRMVIDEEWASSVKVLDHSSTSAEISAVRQASMEGGWREGDRWGSTWELEFDVKSCEAGQGTRGPTGHMLLTWQRHGDTVDSPSHETRIPLPVCLPPHLNARVLVAAPPVTHALQAFTLVFVVVNPSNAMVDVSLAIDDDDAWVVGHRTVSIPGVPPRGSRSIPTRLVAKTEGKWPLPRVRAFQQRSMEAVEASGGLLLNEGQYGLPLHVRYRASAGATLGAAAQRALAIGQVPAEQEGTSLSVLVLGPEGQSVGS
ncbi:unnamed protein product [Jaminaea pallidilutea]